MKNIALVKINLAVDMNMPPLGLLYIGDALTKAGYKVKIHHILPEDVNNCAQEIVQDSPLFVGFSVFTGNCMPSYAALSRLIKSKTDIPTVWGNAHPSLLPEQCLNEDYIDIICIGEGELTSVELANALENKIDLSQVKGISYKKKGLAVINAEREFIKDLDNYYLNWDLVDITKYIQPRWKLKRVLPVTTSRGCPYACGFCYNQQFNRRKWRAHSVDFVVSRLKDLVNKHNLDGLLFLDDEFFVDKNRSFKIVEDIGLPYYTNARVEYVDEEFAQRLNVSKCRVIMFGIESGSDRVLSDVIHKGSTVKDSLKAVGILSKYKDLEIAISLIFAFPGETYEEFRASVKLIIKLLKIHPNMSVTTGFFLPVPGTQLFKSAIKEGFVPPNRTEDWHIMDRWKNKLELTWVRWITSKECVRLRNDLLILSLLYKNNIPVAKDIMSWRIYSGDYFMHFDILIIRLCWRVHGWLIRNIHRIIRKS